MLKTVRRVLVALAAAGFVVTLVVFVRDYGRVAAIVPTHFGANGMPNAWGPKDTFLIFPCVALLMLGLTIGVGTFGLPQKRGPVPEVLPVLVASAFAEMTWIMAFTEIGTFAVALGNAAMLNSGIMFAGLGLVMGTSAAIVIVAVRAACNANP